MVDHVNERFDLVGRSVIITGGGKGIGKVYAEAFAQCGARVVAADIDAAAAGAVAGAITDRGHTAIAATCDIADPNSVAALVRTTLDAFGAIDVLINNASLMSTLPRRSWLEIPLEEWDQVMTVNLRGMFLCCRAVFPAMRQQRTWQDRQHLVESDLGRHAEPSALHHLEGRRDRLHPRARPRGRRIRHHRQRHHAGADAERFAIAVLRAPTISAPNPLPTAP